MKIKNKNLMLLTTLSSLLIYSAYISISSDDEDKKGLSILKPNYSEILKDTESGFIFKEEEKIEISKTISIYINPSVQTWNLYANNLGNEAQHMQIIATEMYNILSKYSFLDVEGNLEIKGMSLENSIKDSNSKKRDIHLALHSNAGGGSGSEIYTKNNYDFATSLYNEFVKDLPFPRRGVKNGNHLYEVKSINASNVALIEILFHDNLTEASYIINNHLNIAKSLSESLLKYILENYQ